MSKIIKGVTVEVLKTLLKEEFERLHQRIDKLEQTFEEFKRANEQAHKEIMQANDQAHKQIMQANEEAHRDMRADIRHLNARLDQLHQVFLNMLQTVIQMQQSLIKKAASS